MALQTKPSYEQKCDCKLSRFDDLTGNYDPADNPGGYGAPNVASSAITSASFAIKKSTWDSPITLNFTIASNVITAATVTDQFGNVRNVLALLSNTVFPFTNQVFDSILLYGTAQQEELASGTYYCTYTVSNGTTPVSSILWTFFTCKYDSCVEESIIRKAKGQIGDSDAIQIYYAYDSMYVFVGLSNPTAVQEQMEILDHLCSQCGCCSNHNSEED